MSQIAERLLLPTVGDRDKIPGQLKEQALLRSWLRYFSLRVHVFVEEADLEGLRNSIQPSTGQWADAPLIFVGQLVVDAEAVVHGSEAWAQ